jgi:hypothetical protein
VVCQGKFTKKISNSSTEELFYHPDSPAYPWVFEPDGFPYGKLIDGKEY